MLELIHEELEERSSSQLLCTELLALAQKEATVHHETRSDNQVSELPGEAPEGLCHDGADDDLRWGEGDSQNTQEDIEKKPVLQETIEECCEDSKPNRVFSTDGKSVLDIAVQAYKQERLQIHKVNGQFSAALFVVKHYTRLIGISFAFCDHLHFWQGWQIIIIAWHW